MRRRIGPIWSFRCGRGGVGHEAALKHDPDPKGRVSAKCEAVFRKDHART
jgi:hypothetical protein